MNILDLLRSIGQPKVAPPVQVSAIQDPVFTPEQASAIARSGASMNDLQKLLAQQSEISYDRASLAGLYSSMLADPIISGALGVYAETAVSVSPSRGRSMWVSSKDAETNTELNALLDSISIEERLYDWAQTIAQYGDLFIDVNGQPGVGILSIEDTTHPIERGRIDIGGRLVGFFKTPTAFLTKDSSMTSFKTEMLAPWQVVHFRNLAGYKRRLPMDANTSSYSTNFAMGGPTIEGTASYASRYGTSVLFDALLPFKRYRLASDSLMLCRLGKGPKRNIFALGIPEKTSNPAMVQSLVEEVKKLLARSTIQDTRATSANFSSRQDKPASNQDILIPVFGQANNLAITQLSGDADIKWIADIDDLRAQLCTALRVPQAMLAGYSAEGPSNDWSGKGLENVDIRFSKSVRRVQKTLIQGVTRLCQIHMAFMGKDPDPTKFEVSMNITSSAEEIQLQSAAKDAGDTVEKLMTIAVDALGEGGADKVGLLRYFNGKFLRLDDLDLRKYQLTPAVVRSDDGSEVEVDFGKPGGAGAPAKDSNAPAEPTDAEKKASIPLEPDATMPKESRQFGSDNMAALPVDLVTVKTVLKEKVGKKMTETVKENVVKSNESWHAKFGKMIIEVKREG